MTFSLKRKRTLPVLVVRRDDATAVSDPHTKNWPPDKPEKTKKRTDHDRQGF